MELRRFLVHKLILFCILSTLITGAVSLIGAIFDGQASLRYEDLLSPLGYAALCLLPTLVTWSRRELSAREVLGRKALMLLLLEGIILLLAYRSPVIDTGRMVVVVTIAGSVVAIFVLVNLILWLKDSAEAEKMNADLAAYQSLHEER